MAVWKMGTPLAGWHLVKDGIPEEGVEIEILHFGNWPEQRIFDTATVGKGTIYPHAKDGGHAAPSTVTHWRYKGEGEDKGKG